MGLSGQGSRLAILFVVVLSSHSIATAQRVETFPLSEHECAFVSANIGGTSLHLVVDSGAEVTVLDRRFRALLGGWSRTRVVRSFTSSADVPFYAVPQIRLGETEVRIEDVACVDLGDKLKGEGVDGFLGMDVLKRFQLDLDWDRGSITILRPPKHLVTDHARLVQMRHLENGLPVISASANGKPEWEFFVDTGFSGAIMLPAIDEDVVVKEGLQPKVASKTLTIFGEDKNVRMRLNELKAGNIRFGNIICTISTTCEKRIVGIGLFRHYRTIMNFPAAEIEFIPRKSVQQDEADMSGVKLLRIDGKVVVVFIDREMPGAEAGVLEGDEIIELNGKPVRDASPQSLRALLHEGDGKKVSLGILRNGVEKKIEFVLRRQI